ncbi:hypothetical protein G7046_g9900 [Stylonectria norvegica]|nr:hypothetical protein G7046_g9900 [Stylonectria norvegica]
MLDVRVQFRAHRPSRAHLAVMDRQTIRFVHPPWAPVPQSLKRAAPHCTNSEVPAASLRPAHYHQTSSPVPCSLWVASVPVDFESTADHGSEARALSPALYRCLFVVLVRGPSTMFLLLPLSPKQLLLRLACFDNDNLNSFAFPCVYERTEKHANVGHGTRHIPLTPITYYALLPPCLSLGRTLLPPPKLRFPPPSSLVAASSHDRRTRRRSTVR